LHVRINFLTNMLYTTYNEIVLERIGENNE